MQRRAVAVYVAFFLVIAAASYTLLATAEEPTITLEDPEYELAQGETFTVGGQQYTVTTIEESDGAGSGTIEWTESDVEMTETWANEDTVEIDGTEWQVLIEGENATAFTFQEVQDRQAILENDPDAANETQEIDGQEYVVIQSGGGQELVPAEEYFAAPATQSFSVGDQFAYNNQTVTVDEITADGVTVGWTEDQTNTQDLSNEGTAELADSTEYLVLFPDSSTVQLTSDMTSYNAQVEAQNQFSERTSGFRWVTFTSLLFVFSLIAFAFLPSRY
ncbi:hypothetical protein halTADL_2212 [Halohasta litchfieldiae]|jgi:hypothetical protein|uniref:Uncharacterized protein n=1 Tax=Halohasta litchfieldiae TaxID=1073996 RepID=A0A1H6VHX6_9EURY|nr:hypothetical protein [Halohasta litchfieldiae]ATW88959.1 hypothetical protein halTADL_2212 [Halohasta litchfieldiae]SEJ01337.1 hypothetical protein SAMN05444271_11631 [Halohasta litchfieldiae]